MLYYANSDIDGKIIGFYNDDVHTAEQIPATAAAITEEQWQDVLSNPRKYRVISGVFTARTQAVIDQEIADEEANAPPLPVTGAQKISALEEENLNLMLAIAEVYEEKEAEKAVAQEESINIMLAITEIYELMTGGN